MREQGDRDELWERLYDAAPKDTLPSVGWQILSDYLGTFLVDYIGDWPEALLSTDPNLEEFASLLGDEVIRLADEYALAPFDGTLCDREAEWKWLVQEDLLPFVRQWHRNARMLISAEGHAGD